MKKIILTADDFGIDKETVRKVKIKGLKILADLVANTITNSYEDILKLKDIEEVFNMPGGKEKYWETVFLIVFLVAMMLL